MKIAVVGTGYVGLVTGTCLADTGNHVTCVDIDTRKIAALQSGELTIFEPGLEKIFERNIKAERLAFTTDLAEGIKDAVMIFLALPTPQGADGNADLQYVLNVSADIGKLLTGYKIIVNKSTVPVGTGAKVREVIAQHYKGDFDVVSNPEFLKEGVAVDDFMKPDRIVIGSESDKATRLMTDLYLPFVRQGNPIMVMDIVSAELTKYAANSFLATKISFMNEMSRLCEVVGADVDFVRKGIGADDRIGKRFLFPGIGYGGSCFPKDVKALATNSANKGYDFKILNAVLEVNEDQQKSFAEKILRYFNNEVEGKKFAVWGLSFKPNTDDIRDAPSLNIIRALLSKGAVVNTFDPEAMNNVRAQLGDSIGYCETMYDCLEGADALIICTEWNEFRVPDFELMKAKLSSPVIFDGRNLFDLKQMEELGFYYQSIGRRIIKTDERG